MTKLTTALVCTALASVAFAGPKPLLNPFAETITASAPTASAPTAPSYNNAPIAPMNTQIATAGTTALPTAQNVRAQHEPVMTANNTIRLVVKGQGVAPSFTQSPAQAFALAKRAAMVDAYRLLGEKVSGVRVEGQDIIKNMMVKRSQVRTEVNTMIRQASVVETDFKDGLCEVEVELIVSGNKWYHSLSQSFAQ